MNSGLRKLGRSVISLALCWGVCGNIYAEETAEAALKDKQSFNTNSKADRYENNATLQKNLEFLGADCVEVRIVGSSDKADVLKVFIGNETSKDFSGKVNTTLPIFDNKIRVEFRSGSYGTDKGFQVNLLEKNIDRCLPEIRQEFIKTAQDILHYGANDITSNLETPQSHLSNVQNELRQNGSLDSILPNLIKSFSELASYYRKTAEKASQIKSTLEERLKTLQASRQKVTNIIERLGKGQAEYAGIAERDQMLESRTGVQELKKKYAMSADANQKLAANIAIRKKVWERLQQRQYEVLKPLPLYIENIQVLLHFMGSNAQVYQEAASDTVLRNQRLAGFSTNLEGLKQAQRIISQQEAMLRNALDELEREHEITDKPR